MYLNAISFIWQYEVNLMSSPTADWEKVGDRFYRKIQLYTAVFDQDLELENYVVTGAPYGGALGVFAPVFLPVFYTKFNNARSGSSHNTICLHFHVHVFHIKIVRHGFSLFSYLRGSFL